ncbi:MAG: UDP-N-acetylmuramoyl-L-alanyl-D-glutamate--2,6-diaminopimelate ligase [Solirubrobacteraceae bacterium]
MRLGELTAGLPVSLPDRAAGAAQADSPGAGDGAETEITGLAYDSRAVEPGSLFFCVPGFRSDGHDYAAAAVRAGAAALVVERPLGLGVPELVVGSARAAMAPLAARFFGEPARELEVVGITGTNGKTTSAYLVRALIEATGRSCGLLGTVKSVVGGLERPVARTTPEAIELQADLRAMLDGGEEACAIEVSSHALELGRADAIPFAAALFTNLTQDHLDFHPTMEDYFLAKRRLFAPEQGEPPRLSVVNAGDPYGRRLARELPGALTFAVEAPADYRASGLRCGFAGCSFVLHTPEGDRELALPMPGRFNVANALGALATVHGMGAPLEALAGALERGVRVPGRFEPVDRGQDFAVLVDYAHTPDSLENVLRSARELIAASGSTQGRVICVFGAGGDRDRGKRPMMGEISSELADITIVTSDNPRSEDPERIIEQIMEGVRPSGAGDVEAITDRREAIGRAVSLAGPGDVLVIAGKGHEQGQELAGARKVPFDDVTVAGEALEARDPSVARAGTR